MNCHERYHLIFVLIFDLFLSQSNFVLFHSARLFIIIIIIIIIVIIIIVIIIIVIIIIVIMIMIMIIIFLCSTLSLRIL